MGKPVDPPALLAPKDKEQIIEIVVREQLKRKSVPVTPGPIPRITIPEQLSHPLVLTTEKLLVAGKEDWTKRIRPHEGSCLDICVSRDQMSRALRILNALFLALEERGCTLSWPEEQASGPSLLIDGELVKFGICEICEAQRHVLTAAEKRNPHTAPQWDYRLTGRLELFVGKMPYASKGRSSWSDTRLQPLETCLEPFVLRLSVAAATIKKNRLEMEELERYWEEERKKEEEERSRAIEENRKADLIAELMRDWNQSRSLRAFAKVIAEAAQGLELSDQEKNGIQQVVDWTRDYAEILDPITGLPESIEEFAHPGKIYTERR